MPVDAPQVHRLSSQRTELTPYQKAQILEARALGKTPTQIHMQLGIPRSTIMTFLDRALRHKSIDNLPQSGRPRAMSVRQDHYMIRTAEANTRIPFTELRNITNTHVSIRTIQRRLQEDHLRKWRAVTRALLTEEHAKKRLNWARKHRGWTVDDWKRVIWSDECAVQKDSNPRQMWVFRHQNKREKYAPTNIHGRSKDGDIYQMIWGCFGSDKLGPIVFIDGKINSDKYIELLRSNFLPYVDALINDGATNITFQQDNATPHTAKKSCAWMEEEFKEREIELMVWPSNSPDMSPIENLWAHLKLELHHRYPDTSSLHGSPDTFKRILIPRLMEVWWSIGAEVLNALIESMPRRVNALWEAKGWYTAY